MARYIGPKSRIARRFGEPIFGADKVLAKRNFPPGQHGNNRRRKVSEYGAQLAEKQKAKYTYGVRLGIAPTRAAARQLVSHKHIVVNGNVVNIASYQVKAGDVVGVREKAKSLEVIEAALAGFNHSKYPWLEWDDNAKCGKFLHRPDRADIPENIKEQLIVELYSKQ